MGGWVFLEVCRDLFLVVKVCVCGVGGRKGESDRATEITGPPLGNALHFQRRYRCVAGTSALQVCANSGLRLNKEESRFLTVTGVRDSDLCGASTRPRHVAAHGLCNEEDEAHLRMARTTTSQEMKLTQTRIWRFASPSEVAS